jgi:carboxyl-terminal processing protease
VQNRDGTVESKNDPEDGVRYAGPLAVLISKQSASASEILAGAVQDYGRGLILGNSRTYGKASVQTVIDLPGSGGRDSDGAMKVTVSKFFRPSGKSNQVLGVESDIQIPDVFEVSDVGEGENDFPLPHTTINAYDGLKPIQNLSSVVPQLRQRSENRVRAAQDFKEIFVAIDKAKKEKDNTLLSLKAADRPLADATDMNAGQKVASTNDPKTTQSAAKDKEKSGRERKSRFEDPNIVVRPEDQQLKEAGHILVDSIELLGGKTDWTK